MKSEPTITYALIYRVHDDRFPENDKFDDERVIQQVVISKTKDDTEDTRRQAVRQACGYLRRAIGTFISPDDAGFDLGEGVVLVRVEERRNSRRPSMVTRAKRIKQGLASKPVIQSPPTQPEPAPVAKPVQPALTF